MNINELKYFREELDLNMEKVALLPIIKSLAKKLVPTKAFKARAKTGAKSLTGTTVVAGGLATGGLVYGTVSQPSSIRHANNYGFNR